jgi:hypothetical protein
MKANTVIRRNILGHTAHRRNLCLMRTKNKSKLTFSALATLALVLLVSAPFAAVPSAMSSSANSNMSLVLNSGTCSSDFGGTWDSSTSTCTVTSATLSSGYTLTIRSRTTLVVSFYFYNSGGTVINFGKILITSSGTFENSGTVINHGVISISNGGDSITGFLNEDTLTNYGKIFISNTGGSAEGLVNEGLLNENTVINYGKIFVDNNGKFTIGFENFGTVINHDKISISNSGEFSYGFDNWQIVVNHGVISTCGSSGNGFVNEGNPGLSYTGHPVRGC